MAKVDFEKIKQKIAEDAAKANKNRKLDIVRRFKFKVGENKIRILPPWTEEGVYANQFWLEGYKHWNIGEGGLDEENGKIFTCPALTPNSPHTSCPICDYRKMLFATEEPANIELAKSLKARCEYVSNIVNLKDPVYTQADVDEWEEQNPGSNEESPVKVGNTKVQVLNYASSVYNQIMDIFKDEIDITDLETGHDLIVTRQGSGRFDTEYRVRINPKSTPFTFVGDLDTSLYQLDKMLKFAEPADMQKCLDGVPMGTTPALTSAPRNAIPGLPPRTTTPSSKSTRTQLMAQDEGAEDSEGP